MSFLLRTHLLEAAVALSWPKGLKSSAPFTVNPWPFDLYKVQTQRSEMAMVFDGYPLQPQLVRTNRNAGGMKLLCALVGKAPYLGLMTDEGRSPPAIDNALGYLESLGNYHATNTRVVVFWN